MRISILTKDNKYKPVSTKQRDFLKSEAYVTVFGGSAGSAKTYGGLLRHYTFINDPNYVGYVIRKTAANLRGTGGAFDTAIKIYKNLEPNITFTKQPMVIKFPSGATIQFVGLDGDAGINFFHGLEVSGAMFDEATQNQESEVLWVMSRLRTNSKMKPNIWLTCNPDPDSFIFKWIEWYLYPKGTYVDGVLVEGRPDPAKNGAVRYFLRFGDELVWGDTAEELREEHKGRLAQGQEPKSFKFIGATCHDNPALLKSNPDYISSLLNQGRINAERLYYGNWYARESSTGYFKRDWIEVIDELPDESEIIARVRCWDIAGTLPSEQNPDPDFTAGVLIAKTRDNKFIIEDVIRDRKRFGAVYDWVAQVALKDFDFNGVFDVFIPQDPSANGKFAAQEAVKNIAKYGVFAKKIPSSGHSSKLSRFKPFSAASEAGLVKVLRADWNDVYFSELERFDGTRRCGHDDKQSVSI